MKTRFYSIPAEKLIPGVSTDDGQDVLKVSKDSNGWIWATVYTPRSDDPGQDAENMMYPETRGYAPGEQVDLAVFEDTQVDLSESDE